jgi:hypothetical protein
MHCQRVSHRLEGSACLRRVSESLGARQSMGAGRDEMERKLKEG